jgi:hypothetical protein
LANEWRLFEKLIATKQHFERTLLLEQLTESTSEPTNARSDGLVSLATSDAYGTIGSMGLFGGSLGPPIRLS